MAYRVDDGDFMMILYFEVSSMMLSNRYITNNPDLTNLLGLRLINPNKFWEHVRLDIESISMLNEFCRTSGVKIFPLGTDYSREFLITQGVDAGVLAPDVKIRMRMDERSVIRRMLSHAAAVGADDWLIIGDVNVDSLKSQFIEHYVDSVFGLGVTPELISALYERVNENSDR